MILDNKGLKGMCQYVHRDIKMNRAQCKLGYNFNIFSYIIILPHSL